MADLVTYRPALNAVASAEGVNSESDVSGALWSGDNWTGAGELQPFQYVTASLQTDAPGTLFFDFSVNGSDWSSFPVAGFDVSAGIHEYHSAHKSLRYFRPRFVGDSTPTYFRLKVDYTDSAVALNSPLNQGVGPDSDAATVKAVGFGQQPDGEFVSENSDGTAWSESTPLAADATFTSDWFDSDGWSTIAPFFSSDVLSAADGIVVEYTDDAQAVTPVVRASQLFTFLPEDITRGFRSLLLPVLLDGFRIKYTNGPTLQTDFYVQVDLRVRPSSVFSVLVGENEDNPGERILVKTTADGALITSTDSSIINFVYDAYAKVVVDTVTDRFDYYVGGLAGTKVAEIEIIYADSSKTDTVSAERTNV